MFIKLKQIETFTTRKINTNNKLLTSLSIFFDGFAFVFITNLSIIIIFTIELIFNSLTPI